jgi:hypothetical protein
MSTEIFDWGLREAVGIVELLTKEDKDVDWGFKKTIDKAIAVVEGEWEALRKAEAAKKARFEKAREKAKVVRDHVIIPLLKDLRDDFAADEERVLPLWNVQSQDRDDAFLATATVPDIEVSRATRLVIRAEASVADPGPSVDLSVECSSVTPNSESDSQLAPLLHSVRKLPAEQKVDERGSRTWLHKQLSECARICIVTRMRGYPTLGG